MLAYIDDVPVVGAPGCARSRKVNIVDWILPRLLAGDQLTRQDIVKLGHGGLLQDVRERGLPRDIEIKEDDDTTIEPKSTTLISSSA
jgi:molybdenum cofactor cytidylyltransferase